ncbi:hypothetical protein FQR65_LT20313 [Abscondita terminalis]|nr:hypothetical protein FQR65_LT20313 [Abscondita terminalis]
MADSPDTRGQAVAELSGHRTQSGRQRPVQGKHHLAFARVPWIKPWGPDTSEQGAGSAADRQRCCSLRPGGGAVGPGSTSNLQALETVDELAPLRRSCCRSTIARASDIAQLFQALPGRAGIRTTAVRIAVVSGPTTSSPSRTPERLPRLNCGDR